MSNSPPEHPRYHAHMAVVLPVVIRCADTTQKVFAENSGIPQSEVRNVCGFSVQAIRPVLRFGIEVFEVDDLEPFEGCPDVRRQQAEALDIGDYPREQ